VAERLEVARQTAFAAAEIEGSPAGRRKKCEELVAMETPVAVESRLACPRDERGCVLLPGRAEIGGRELHALEWAVSRARHGVGEIGAL
jgi:hypothetical protein